MLNNKSILITGGTESFGQAFIRTILEKYPEIARLVVLSLDELKQYEMSQDIPQSKYRTNRQWLTVAQIRDLIRMHVDQGFIPFASAGPDNR